MPSGEQALAFETAVQLLLEPQAAATKVALVQAADCVLSARPQELARTFMQTALPVLQKVRPGRREGEVCRITLQNLSEPLS